MQGEGKGRSRYNHKIGKAWHCRQVVKAWGQRRGEGGKGRGQWQAGKAKVRQGGAGREWGRACQGIKKHTIREECPVPPVPSSSQGHLKSKLIQIEMR